MHDPVQCVQCIVHIFLSLRKYTRLLIHNSDPIEDGTHASAGDYGYQQRLIVSDHGTTFHLVGCPLVPSICTTLSVTLEQNTGRKHSPLIEEPFH